MVSITVLCKVNSKHKYLFIKELFRGNSRILQTFQLTEITRNFKCLNDGS